MAQSYKSKNLDHLGIVAAVCDQINLVSQVDALIPSDPRAKMSLGEALKLMIVNGLGFTSKPLYLQARFFSCRPVSALLGREIESEVITDDRLGRALDAFYLYGCEPLFALIAAKAAQFYNVQGSSRHLDTTSMNVYGNYESEEEEPFITFGHSKDHRPDLKQFMISLVCSNDGDIPLLAQTLKGNTSDKSHFLETVRSLREQVKAADSSTYYLVADSALYTKESLLQMDQTVKWVTRVPETIKEARERLLETPQEAMLPLAEGYMGKELTSHYAGVAQRWLVVYSEQGYKRERETLNRKVLKESELAKKELMKFQHRKFECEKDARDSLSLLGKSFKYHTLECTEIETQNRKQGRGRPSKSSPATLSYSVKARVQEAPEKIQLSLRTKGKFILATNEISPSFTPSDLLSTYKSQQAPERGFRFLKDPLFLTSSVFLKNPERIIALGMVMCLCLLIYTLAQRHLRQKLQESAASVPSQTGKPTKKPTMRWIFQFFEGISVLLIYEGKQRREVILNLDPIQEHILLILGPPFQRMYEREAA